MSAWAYETLTVVVLKMQGGSTEKKMESSKEKKNLTGGNT